MVSARRPRTQPGHQRSSEIPGPGLAHDPYAAATHRLEFRGSHPTLQDRQVLMNAAAAAEVPLAEFVYVKLGSVSERPGERVTRNANGIVGLLQLAEDLDGPVAASRRNRISARVSGPRNDAAHRGITPSESGLADALTEVRDLLDRYAPAPTPD